MIKHFSKNTQGSDFIVGDIHGHFSVFEEKLKEINFNPEVDRMFSVGDLVDRGPESHRCLEFLAKPWFHPVLGNHEQLCLDIISGHDDIGLHPRNGGGWVLEQENPEQFAEAFKNMPIAIEVETDAGLIGIIHAECPVDDWFSLSMHKNNDWIKQECIWSRNLVYGNNHLVVKRVHKIFHGHTIMKQVVELGNRVYIDTGVFLPEGSLTIIKL